MFFEDCESAKARGNLVSKGQNTFFDPNIMSIIIVKCEQKIKLFFVIKVIEYHIAVKRD